ncbi:thiazole synthase, partial [Erwinia amylovora]|nr:thiazole synthase [Erwinia amylovora]
IRAGYDARSAGLIERRDMATASTPIFGMAQFS